MGRRRNIYPELAESTERPISTSDQRSGGAQGAARRAPFAALRWERDDAAQELGRSEGILKTCRQGEAEFPDWMVTCSPASSGGRIDPPMQREAVRPIDSDGEERVQGTMRGLYTILRENNSAWRPEY